jgi:hypothetical protein
MRIIYCFKEQKSYVDKICGIRYLKIKIQWTCRNEVIEYIISVMFRTYIMLSKTYII